MCVASLSLPPLSHLVGGHGDGRQGNTAKRKVHPVVVGGAVRLRNGGGERRRGGLARIGASQKKNAANAR